MRCLHRFHDSGDAALTNGALHGQPRHRHTPGKAVAQPFEHRLQNGWYAGENVHIAKDETRRRAQRVVDEARIFGNVSHFLPRCVEFDVSIPVMRNQPRLRLGMTDHFLAESRSNAFGGNVVMGRPDAAACEDQIIGG